eukprot:scaffold6615_cov172-Amphora_coffeaeformis.AAC.1
MYFLGVVSIDEIETESQARKRGEPCSRVEVWYGEATPKNRPSLDDDNCSRGTSFVADKSEGEEKECKKCDRKLVLGVGFGYFGNWDPHPNYNRNVTSDVAFSVAGMLVVGADRCVRSLLVTQQQSTVLTAAVWKAFDLKTLAVFV